MFQFLLYYSESRRMVRIGDGRSEETLLLQPKPSHFIFSSLRFLHLKRALVIPYFKRTRSSLKLPILLGFVSSFSPLFCGTFILHL